MKRTKFGGIAATAAFLLAAGTGSVQAQEAEVSANVAIASDYAFRGISQTLEEPAVQGGLDVSAPFGVYVGTWASSVNFGEDLGGGPRAQMELDFYGGVAPTFGPLELDLGAIYYLYPGADSGREYDYLELYGGAGSAVGPVGLGVSVAYSPEFFAESGTGLWTGAEASVGVPGTPLAVDGSIGWQSIELNDAFGTPDYMAWSAGVGTELMGASIGAMVTGTNIDQEAEECFGDAESDLCSTRFIFSVGRAF